MKEVIGKPWAVPCDPPNSFDCWELCRYVRETVFDLWTPSVVDKALRQPSDRRYIDTPPTGWMQLNDPQVGCVVRMGRTHVGVYLDRDSIMEGVDKDLI